MVPENATRKGGGAEGTYSLLAIADWLRTTVEGFLILPGQRVITCIANSFQCANCGDPHQSGSAVCCSLKSETEILALQERA